MKYYMGLRYIKNSQEVKRGKIAYSGFRDSACLVYLVGLVKASVVSYPIYLDSIQTWI
jgi:hypothetical protein